MDRLKQQPAVAPVIRLIESHPWITVWILLSVGMIMLLVYEAHNVDLTAGNWLALSVVTVAIIGIPIGIVSIFAAWIRTLANGRN
jgi:hypothetical protein